MYDVFISYKSEEGDHARRIADEFKQRGYRVWWSEKLFAGQDFYREVYEVIDQAKAVVVIWSERSIDSKWVFNEAVYAEEQDKLIPVVIGDVKAPPHFRRYHCLDITPWLASPRKDNFDSLEAAVVEKLRAADPLVRPPKEEPEIKEPEPPPVQPPPQSLPKRIFPRWPLALALVSVAGLLAAATQFVDWPITAPTQAADVNLDQTTNAPWPDLVVYAGADETERVRAAVQGLGIEVRDGRREGALDGTPVTSLFPDKSVDFIRFKQLALILMDEGLFVFREIRPKKKSRSYIVDIGSSTKAPDQLEPFTRAEIEAANFFCSDNRPSPRAPLEWSEQMITDYCFSR